MKMYKIRDFALLKNMSTEAIYKKIRLGMEAKFNENDELVTSEEYYQEYLKTRKRGRPKKGEENGK